MSSYPKWLYHPTEPAVVVEDEASHKALGPGWVESPADIKAAEPKKSFTPQEPPAEGSTYTERGKHYKVK